jgi:DNA polymerase-3 subunit delta
MEAVEKLILYTGEKRVIDESDVEELIEKTKEGTIFDLTNALSEKKLLPALAALKNLSDQGVHHLMILSMLVREIRLLLHAGMLIRGGMFHSFNPKADYPRFQRDVYPLIRSWISDAGGKEKGGELISQNPYVIYHALKNSHRFAIEILTGHLEELVRMDTWMKSSARDPGLLLEQFVITVCSS